MPNFCSLLPGVSHDTNPPDDVVECPRCHREHEHIDTFVQFSRYMSHWRCPRCGCNWAADIFSKKT